MGFAVLVGLGALAFLAGSALAHRGWGGAQRAGSSRGEETLVAWLLGLAVVLVPIHVLGWTNTLSPASIAASILGLSLVAIAAAAWPLGRAGFLASAEAALANLRLPFTALREAYRARSTTLFALLLLYGVWLYTAWLAWLAPSSSWDGLMYHEGMVAFALQYGGYEWVDLPRGDQINGFPRGAEALQLFLVAFTDRRLIDFAHHLTAIPTVLVSYTLARRFAPRRVALGLAAAAFLVPGFVLQLRSTYIDVTVTALLLSTIHFATRPGMRVRDLWMLALTAGLYAGMKANAPLAVPFLLLVALVRSVPLLRRGVRARTLLTFVFGLAIVVGLGAPTYVRNYLRTENPAWPVTVKVPIVGVEFDGIANTQDQHWPFDRVVRELYGLPKPGHDFVDTRYRGYGHAVPFLILPIALVALVGAVWRLLGAIARRRAPPDLVQVLLLTIVIVGAQLPSPAFWWARFNLHGVVLLFVATAWALRLPKRALLAEGVIGACTVIAAMTLYWADPAWDVTLDEARALAELPAEARAVEQIGPVLMAKPVAVAREREIGPGDVVAWSAGFIGVAWNEELSNDVVWVDFGPRFLERLDEAGAHWAIVRPGPAERALAASPKYERIGVVRPRVVAFRRTSR